ncbi:hypothetical protein BLA15945_00826 [Burkholderia lata]|uniref:Uncharacterized protein n=1 Tax=Burkholderia lata (strain ATCC 17760 / DSM 23089 / LMG 22485 / NCIMB 9086 / R18194 / 383) TaxID=482957 RepID=A0A6P2HQW2_BURL3|nr:hypothetical protein BLA15945_00826 [Burkholderia lata]
MSCDSPCALIVIALFEKNMEIVMSTHATFTFGLQCGGSVVLYIPHNGYPFDAAVYLLAAHLSNAGAPLVDRFHRVNKVTELTSLEAPKNLSYHYVIDLAGYLFAYQRDSRTGEWMRFFSGHYAEFINEHAPFAAFGDGTLKLIRTSSAGDDREWVTRGQLIARHAAAVAALSSHCERFPEQADAIAGYQDDVDSLAIALHQYNSNNID